MYPLLDTKLYLPHPPDDLVARPHLVARLDAGLRYPLTLVCAPAGYGKSTLVASWLRARMAGAAPGDPPPLQVAWYSIDGADNDDTLFVTYLLGALRGTERSAAPTLTAFLEAEHAPGADQLASDLARAWSSWPHLTILVLDDYHHITNPRIHRLIAQLVRQAPPSLRIIINTRVDPPLGLGRLRARHSLTELRAHHLQFSVAETQEFLGHVLAEPVDTAMIELLHERTEGWIVGLRLAALTMRSGQVETVLRNFSDYSNRYIMDYLMDEVLAHQPSEVVDFLLRTSILARFNSDLCAAVLGQPDRMASQATLERMDEQNLFVVTLDDHRGWYRYHQQLRIMLQHRLWGRLRAGEIAALHSAAATWHARHGWTDEALSHALAAGDTATAARLVESALPDALAAGQASHLTRWLGRLPDAETARRPGLLLARAWALHYSSAHKQIPGLLRQAENLLDDPAAAAPAQTREWRAQILALRSSRAFADTSVEARMASAQQALAMLPPGPSWLRGLTYVFLARAMTAAGQGATARRLIEAELDRDAFSLSFRVRLHLALLGIDLYGGTVGQLAYNAARLRDAARQAGMLNHQLWGEFGLAQAAYESGDLDAAMEHLAVIFADPDQLQLQMLLLAAYLWLSVHGAGGQVEAGRQVIDVLRRRVKENVDARSLSELVALDAYWSVQAGQGAAAATWARSAGRAPGPVDDRAVRFLVLARVLLALGSMADLAAADDLLRDLGTYYEGLHHTWGLVESLVLRACVRRAQGRRRAALDALERAVALGQPLGRVRVFTEHGAAIGDLLHELTRESRCAPQAQALLEALVWAKPSAAATTIAGAEPLPHLEPLTDRELQILSLMGARLTNKEIGYRLSISPLTVRNHTARIYAKLNVTGRQQAVRLAQAMGLLAQA